MERTRTPAQVPVATVLRRAGSPQSSLGPPETLSALKGVSGHRVEDPFAFEDRILDFGRSLEGGDANADSGVQTDKCQTRKSGVQRR